MELFEQFFEPKPSSLLRSGRKAGRSLKVLKKQGRRRSIPSTTLPAPDIEIGSRHPVNYRMPGILPGMCEPFHKNRKSCGGACHR
jgi:hypothetical protein